MNIQIKTTNITLTAAISDYVDKRLSKAAKIIGNDTTAQCDVELARTTEHHNKGDVFRAEIHIVATGRNLYASSQKEDLYTAIDDARAEVLRELKGDKDKRTSLIRRGGAQIKDMAKGLWPWGRNS